MENRSKLAESSRAWGNSTDNDARVTTQSDDLFEQALARYRAGDLEACREVALRGLRDHPQDFNLLRIAGKASADLDLGGASDYFGRAVELEPENGDAWREFGDALVYEQRLDEAARALRQAAELRPDDVPTLVQLGTVLYVVGSTDDAIAALELALERKPGDLGALRSLTAVCRSAGLRERALVLARTIVALTLDDVDAAIDVAELCLELGRLDEAVDAFQWLREIDDEPEHEVYACHGMIEAELRREGWRSALDLAIDATRVDRYGRTTDLLAYVVVQVFGSSGRRAPSRRDIEDMLEASRAEHRRLHAALVV